MPNDTTSRAAILATAINTIFSKPTKRVLKHAEAINVIAKLDGARNDNVVQPQHHAASAGETVGTARARVATRLAIQTEMARTMIKQELRGDSWPHEIHVQNAESIFDALPSLVKTALHITRRTDADLERNLVELEVEDGGTAFADRHADLDAYVTTILAWDLQEAVSANIRERIAAKHPALATMTRAICADMMGSTIAKMLDGADAATPISEIAERIAFPGDWRIMPDDQQDDPIFAQYRKEPSALAATAAVVEALGATPGDVMEQTHRDLSWTGVCVLAIAKSALYGGEGMLHCIENVDHENQTLEIIV